MKEFWLTDYEPEVQIELFKVGHRGAMRSALSATALMTVILVTVWPYSSDQSKLLYVGICLAAIAMRLVSWRQFQVCAKELSVWSDDLPKLPDSGALKAPQLWSASLAKKWQWRSALGMALQGGATGAVGLFFAEHAIINMLLICAYCATLSYALVANSSHDAPAFFLGQGSGAVVISMFLPSAFTDAAVYLLPLNFFFCVLLSIAGVGTHRTFVNLVRLKIANANLAQINQLAARRADRANQDKSDFLAAASHDMRQPVHALMMFVESLRQYRRDNAPSIEPTDARATEDRLISQIANASQVIGAMFNDLMELSRLESGVQSPQYSKVLLAPLVVQCTETVRHEAANKGIRLKLRFSQTGRAAAIDTDRLMLTRAITNLLSNAIRYTEQGKVLVTLRVQATEVDAQPTVDRVRQTAKKRALILSVFDTGVGIAPEHLERIFEPYIQLGNASRDRDKGLGMGLAIVALCLKLIALPVRVRSILGKGSHFSVEFPHWETASPSLPALQEPSPDLISTLKNRAILLIDDDKMVREGLASLMQAWQVNFKAVPTWDEGVKQGLRNNHWCPDLVLCDFRLSGGVDGIHVLTQLLSDFPAAIGLLQTGERAELVQAAADEAGYVVLFKPVSPFLLASALAALLSPESSRLVVAA